MDSIVRNSTIFPFQRAFEIVAERTDKWLEANIGCLRQEVWVLLCLNGAQVNQKQIGECMGIPNPTTVSTLLERMEKKKLLRRSRKPTDRREHKVEMTKKAADILKNYLAHRAEAVRLVFSPLNEQEVEDLRALALKILYPPNRKVDNHG